MIYLFNLSKDDGFCTIVADSVTIYNVKILELIESDDINLWYQNIIKIHQKYNVRHQYYLGSDDFFNVLKLASPEYKRLIYRKEFDDLTNEVRIFYFDKKSWVGMALYLFFQK